MPLRIVLADDHQGLRRALKRFLESHCGWMVCGEAGTGIQAVEKAALLMPDVVILDFAMPGMHGLEAARQISWTLPGMAIVIYSSHAVPGAARQQARKYGVTNFISKAASPERLINALEVLARRLTQRTTQVRQGRQSSRSRERAQSRRKHPKAA